MDNPLTKLAPQLFGDYPKPFLKLYDQVYKTPDVNEESIKDTLWKAYEYRNRYHEGQKRLSGEPYFNHCIAVASTLASWKMDYTTIMAGLLHDVIEDTKITVVCFFEARPMVLVTGPYLPSRRGLWPKYVSEKSQEFEIFRFVRAASVFIKSRPG